MKHSIWNISLAVIQLLPRKIRYQFCRLLFEANEQGDMREASKDLLTLHEELHWHINAMALRYDDGVHPKHRLMRCHARLLLLSLAGRRAGT